MRIALAGTGRLGVGLLNTLLTSEHEVVALLQDGRVTRGAWRWIMPWMGRLFGGKNSVTGRAKREGVPIFWIDKMDESELAPLQALNVDLLLVGGFSIILKKPLLDLPKIGCINTHSSLLPRHRGPNPFYAAIVSGDTESGVSFHIMEPGIDSGPVVYRKSFALKPRETMVSLYVLSCKVATEEILGVLGKIEEEGLHGTPQEESQANYIKNPTMDDAWIDWNDPAELLDRKVRAMCPRIMPRFKWQGKEILVARTRWEETPEGKRWKPGTVLGLRSLRVATGDGILVIDAAFAKRPIYWLWPNPWQKVKVGDRL